MGHKVQFCLIFLPRSKYLFDDSSDRADARSLFWLLWPALGRGRLGNFEMNKILKNIALKSRIYNAKCKLKLLWRETSRTTLSKEKWDKKHVLAQKLIFTTTTHQNDQFCHSPPKKFNPNTKKTPTLTTSLESSSFSDILQRLGRNRSQMTSSAEVVIVSQKNHRYVIMLLN